MSTVANLIERLYRTYLYPPDYEPPMVRAIGDITDNEISFRLTDFQVPEDRDLLRAGVLIEFDQELMRITDFDGIDRIDVVRAQRGTTAVEHSSETFGILAPSFPRHSVFESVRDNIVNLYPRLFTVSHDNLVTLTGRIAGISDPLAVEVQSIWPDNMASSLDLEGYIVDFHPQIGGRALICNLTTGAVWLRYRRRMGVATQEADTLEALGVEEAWSNVVMAGAAADLFVGRDIPAAAVEWISSAFQSEVVPVGDRTQVAATLARYRDVLIERYESEMKSEYRVKVEMKSAFAAQKRGFVG